MFVHSLVTSWRLVCELGDVGTQDLCPACSGERKNTVAPEGVKDVLQPDFCLTVQDYHLRWSQMGERLTHSDVSVKSVTITPSKSSLGLTQILILLSGFLPLLSSVEMRNSWSASSL